MSAGLVDERRRTLSRKSRLKRRRLNDEGVRVLPLVRAKSVPLLPCFLSLVGVAACTWISFRLGQNLGSVGFLYLVFVVLAAVYGGFWQATLVSVVSVGMSRLFLR